MMRCRRSRMQVWAVFLMMTVSASIMKETWCSKMLAQAFSPSIQPQNYRSSGLLLRNINTENSDILPPVPITPCTRICRYNANVFDGKVCVGCFRETYEIGSWEGMAPMEKYYTLLDAVDRLEELVQEPTIDESATGTSRQELLRQAEYWKVEAARTD